MKVNTLILLIVSLFFVVSCDSGLKFDNPLDEHNKTSDSSDTEVTDTDSPDTGDTGHSGDTEPEEAHETGETRTVNCTGIPENAQWFYASSITQTWNGTEWEPSSEGVYSEEASSEECRFICKEHYSYDGTTCNAEKRDALCSAKPENSTWNDGSRNGTFKQTWNGSEWMPQSYAAAYSKTAGECAFTCDTGYFWNGSQCDIAPTQIARCEGLPEGAQWNTALSIIQTWDGEEWIPSSDISYNTEPSSTECRFVCKEHYTWNGSACIADTQTASCPSKPANTVWNDGGAEGTYTQTWTDSGWDPASYSSEYRESAGICRFKCVESYHWESGQCISNTKTDVACTGLASNAQWNTASSITQTWNGTEWTPSASGTYSTSASTTECRYKCKSTYYWYNSECVNPCDYDPCEEVANSTKVCTATAWNQYSCGCDYGYAWNGSECVVPLGNICTNQTKCYDNSSEITCPTSSSADYFGQDAQYAKHGYCYPQSFTVQTLSSKKVVVDNNTGLMWQQTLPTSTCTWEEAKTYCSDLTYAGYSDWRLPSPQEFHTISDNSKYNPAVNTTNFPNMPTSSSSYLWTSKEYHNDTSQAYYFSAYYGNVWYYGTKTKSYNVMCVRGDELPKAAFTTTTISGDAVVTDSATGLMWQKTYPSSKYTWINALKYCKNLNYAGYTDWRLPNKNELASLLNYDKSSAPYSDFPDMPSSYFWSSSTFAYITNDAWSVYFYGGYVDDASKSGNGYVRCVR